jgi:hypothetical protein
MMPGQDHAVGLADVDVHDDQADRFPTYDWGTAPKNLLATRRQLRARGLRQGGHGPVALLRCRKCTGLTRVCTRPAWLYAIELALPVRPMTPAKEHALDRAMAARQTCGACGRRFYTCLSTKLGVCLECHDGTPVDPATVMIWPAATHQLAA